MTFDITALSICDPNKTKCGDAYQIFDNTEEKLLILALADGVGSCVCDWKASEMTCQKFVQYFGENKNETDIPKRIIEAVEETDKAVLNEEGFCAGMKATFVGVIWDYDKGIIYHIGIGDSRIYSIEKEAIRQISKDETTTVIRKGKDGKPLIVSGMTVVSEGVTNVIGALVSVVVRQFEDQNTDGTSRNTREGVLLASDGFYNCKSSFDEDVRLVFNNLDMQTELEKTVRHYKDYQKDDMTVIVVRKKSLNTVSSKEIVACVLKDEMNYFSNFQVLNALFEQITEGVTNQESTYCQSILAYCETHNLQFGHENTSELISKMVKMGSKDGVTYRQLVNMLRKNQI